MKYTFRPHPSSTESLEADVTVPAGGGHAFIAFSATDGKGNPLEIGTLNTTALDLARKYEAALAAFNDGETFSLEPQTTRPGGFHQVIIRARVAPIQYMDSTQFEDAIGLTMKKLRFKSWKQEVSSESVDTRTPRLR